MELVKLKTEKRDPIVCDRCGTKMEFCQEILYSPRDTAVYLKYVCPHREGEQGCGAVKRVCFQREQDLKFRKAFDNFFLVF